MSADDTKLNLGVENLAMAHPVLNREEMQESFKLCRITGVQAVRGQCVIHNTDACISMYVRYNHVFETMEKNFKDAMVKTRTHVS